MGTSDTISILPGTSASTMVVKSLQRWIADGKLAPGDRLPSERVIASQLGVARNTVRKALDIMFDQSLLTKDSKGGRAVAQSGVGWLNQAVLILTARSDIDVDAQPEAGYLEEIGFGAARAVRQRRMHAVSLNPDTLTDADINKFRSEGPVGVLIPEVSSGGEVNQRLSDLFDAIGGRVVLCGGHPDLALRFDRVVSDQAMGSYELTRFLIARGRRRILCFWTHGDKGHWFPSRYEGYQRAMQEAGLKPLPFAVAPGQLRPGPMTIEERQQVFFGNTHLTAGCLLPQFQQFEGVDALMVATDGDIAATASACRLFRLNPGKNIEIVGYDNYWMHWSEREFEAYIPPASVDKNNIQMGVEMVRLLIDRVGSALPPQPQIRSVEPRLVVSRGTES